MNRVRISTASSGANEIVAAPSADKRVRVLGYQLVSANTVTAKWVSGSTDLTGAMTLTVGVPNGFMPGGDANDPFPLLQCGYGEALNLTLGGAVQTSGWLIYDIVY